MSVRGRLTVAVILYLTVSAARALPAQSRSTLPLTPADWLIEDGRWSEADALFYLQSERAPRNPVLRAALGRFLAMKGAVIPGLILIEEARQFGLDTAIANPLLMHLRSILASRASSVRLTHDSTVVVSAPLDSLGSHASAISLATFEAFVPSFDAQTNELTLHTNTRSALSAIGRRYHVLRLTSEVRVLVGEGRVLSLADALRELAPAWWQLDLQHGLLVVR